ncbi:MAG: AraC family transcriptional regulator [Verrucomicrobiae bacterium]|nr:AraC family transcriptional regulator [Verrucomicrobiae bacterium]
MEKIPRARLELLTEARKHEVHLDDENPIHVRRGVVTAPGSVDPPVYHPYLEFGIRLKGTGHLFIEGLPFERLPYDVYLGGINQVHWGTTQTVPMEYITVYFLPGFLSDWGVGRDVIGILNRFSNSLEPKHHLIRPDRKMRNELLKGFKAMHEEFRSDEFGKQIRLRTLLVGMLVELIRWEKRNGASYNASMVTSDDWQPVLKAMKYIRAHCAETVYGREVAREVGVSETRLKMAFSRTLKMPWVKYLQICRVHRAEMLLRQPDRTVADVAFEVGFQSLSHFYRTCRAVTGTSDLRRAPKQS